MLVWFALLRLFVGRFGVDGRVCGFAFCVGMVCAFAFCVGMFDVVFCYLVVALDAVVSSVDSVDDAHSLRFNWCVVWLFGCA